MAVLLVVLVPVAGTWWHTNRPECKARRLLAELRGDPPGRVEQWLIDHDLIEPAPTRDAWDIMEDLAKLGPPAVPVLISGLGDKNPSVRQHSAEAIALIGPPAHEATPHLVAALEDGELRVRFAAADALRLFGRRDVVVPFLLRKLESKDTLERCLAACALGLFDPPAKEAVPALQEALKDKDAPVRDAAEMSLRKIQAGAATREAATRAAATTQPGDKQ